MTTPPGRTRIHWTAFTLRVSLVAVALVLGFTLWSQWQTGRFLERQLLARARAHFNTIVATRDWSASHGGVYVVKSGEVRSNPYLKAPDITDDSGRTLTLYNPATMTREISERASEASILTYHMTSLDPINPANRPDGFEADALRGFESRGTREATAREELDGTPHFRYIGALITRASCLRCHEEQGYTVGQVRGGISVSFPIAEAQRLAAHENDILLAVAASGAAGFLVLFLLLANRLMARVERSTETIRKLSLTDELTGLANRRHTMEKLRDEASRTVRYGTPAAVILMDIDHFKRINDTWGHPTGDTVLAGVANVLRRRVRATDTPGRFGGEEFLVLLPQTTRDEAAELARDVRAAIAAHAFPTPDGEDVSITVSIGVCDIRPDDGEAADERAIARADAALYAAKEGGRDAVVVAQG